MDRVSKILLKAMMRPAPPYMQDGGPGSGNFGHEGRPGEVGGSGSGGGSGGGKSKSVGSASDYHDLKNAPVGSTVTIETPGGDVTFKKNKQGSWEGGGDEYSSYEIADFGSESEINAPGKMAEPDGFADRMEEYISGGYDLDRVMKKEDIQFIREHSTDTTKPMYRLEEARFTAANLKPGQEFEFSGSARSFTRNPEVTRKMLDPASDEYGGHSKPVVFVTSGTTSQFDTHKYAGGYTLGDQEEGLVGGKFKVIKISQTTIHGEKVPVYHIKQTQKP